LYFVSVTRKQTTNVIAATHPQRAARK